MLKNGLGQGVSRRQFLSIAGAAGLGVASAVGFAGCGSSSASGSASAAASSAAASASAEASSAVAAAGLDIENWDSVLEAAKGQTVNVNMMTGADMGAWMNKVIGPRIEELGIKWNLTMAANTVDVVNLISSEMNAGKTEGGSVDVCWINGENFTNLMDAGYLYGPILEVLPSFQFCNLDDPNTTRDSGRDTEGYEVPFQSIWDVFWANTDVIPESEFPKDADSFKALVEKYPGKFTYANLGNYKGTYFVNTIINAVCGKDVWDRVSSEKIEKDELKELIEPALQYLRDLSPNLWNKGASYPADGDQMLQLFSDGEIAMLFETTMPQGAMDEGTVPASTRPFFLESGAIHDIWYMAIPKNAGNLAAALVTVNEIMKPVIQVSQFEAVGYYPFTPYDMMDDEGKAAYDEIKWTDGLIEPTKMDPYAIANIHGQNNDTLEEIWAEEVNGK